MCCQIFVCVAIYLNLRCKVYICVRKYVHALSNICLRCVIFLLRLQSLYLCCEVFACVVKYLLALRSIVNLIEPSGPPYQRVGVVDFNNNTHALKNADMQVCIFQFRLG